MCQFMQNTQIHESVADLRGALPARPLTDQNFVDFVRFFRKYIGSASLFERLAPPPTTSTRSAPANICVSNTDPYLWVECEMSVQMTLPAVGEWVCPTCGTLVVGAPGTYCIGVTAPPCRR